MNEISIAKEVFLSIVKWFLVVLLINNLIWGVVFFATIYNSTADLSVTQDGTENYQEVAHG